MFIYIISAHDTPVKIGLSKHPNKRLKQLQTGNSEKLKLQYTVEVDDDKAILFEKIIHKTNNHTRISGEWFNMSINEAITELDFAVIRYSEELHV